MSAFACSYISRSRLSMFSARSRARFVCSVSFSCSSIAPLYHHVAAQRHLAAPRHANYSESTSRTHHPLSGATAMRAHDWIYVGVKLMGIYYLIIGIVYLLTALAHMSRFGLADSETYRPNLYS